VLASAAYLSCWAVPARAQAPAPTPLQQAVEAAWQRAAQSAVSSARRQQGQAAQAAAGAWAPAAPAVETSYRSDRLQHDRGSREAELALAVPLWWPGQKSAQVAAARAEMDAADVQERAARLAVAGDVREAAWACSAAEAQLLVTRAQHAALQALADDVERRIAAGDLAPVDGMAAKAELLSASDAMAQAQQAFDAAQRQWTLLTGLPPLGDPSEPPAGEADGRQHPELLRAEAHTEYTRLRHEAAQRSRREPPEVTLGMRQERGGHGQPHERSLALSLRVPFGFDGQAASAEAAAAGELAVARLELARTRERLQADRQTAAQALKLAEQQLASAQQRAQLLHERARLLDQSFRAGETSLPDLLRALDAAAQSDAAIARQRAAAGSARARYHQAIGLLP
jgi:cobalt-zinc-cadmium efflux system outer membrane protein